MSQSTPLARPLWPCEPGHGAFGPYLLVLVLGLLIVTFVPWITLVLPERLLALK